MRRSANFPYAALAAIPANAVDAGLARTAQVFVPVGLLAGVALALVVFYLARQQMSLRTALRVALKRKEFFLVYQPIVELRGGRCVGAEALIRWRRSNGDMVRPDVFIPVAEETGLIHEITKRVMDIVARDAAAVVVAHPDLHIGINLSSKDLQSQDTPHLVQDMVRAMGVKPHNILVEATERGFMQADVVRKIMDDIHALNIKIAIDDFGTGYSSLSYLEKFKLDYLKIDKSFVDTMGGKAATSQVAFHIIEMAKSLKLEMIAEGVETEAQARFLQERGVQFAQGYFFAKPLPLSEFVAFVQKSERLAASP
jgi:sensor c-di-GMP phosphodiesterase-like protein